MLTDKLYYFCHYTVLWVVFMFIWRLFRWNCWTSRPKKNMCLCRVVMQLSHGRRVNGWRCQFIRLNHVTYFHVR